MYSLDYGPLIELHARARSRLDGRVRPRAGGQRARRGLHRRGWPHRAHRAPAAAATAPRSCLGAMGVSCSARGFSRGCLAGGAELPATADFARDLVPRPAPAHVLAYVCDTRRATALLANAAHRRPVLARAHGAAPCRAPFALHSDPEWPLFTHHEPLAPACGLADASADAAILSPGCVVAGEVSRSILSRRCRVGANAERAQLGATPGRGGRRGLRARQGHRRLRRDDPAQHDARREVVRGVALLRFARGHRARHVRTAARRLSTLLRARSPDAAGA